MNVDDSQFSPDQNYMNGRSSWQNYSETNSTVGNSSFINNFSDFQIPETVMSFNTQRTKR
jgi:hypothetical protein